MRYSFVCGYETILQRPAAFLGLFGVMLCLIWSGLCSVPILLSCALFYSSSVVILVLLLVCSLLVCVCVCSAKRRISVTSKSAKASIMGCPRAVNERYHGVFALAIFNGCAIGSSVPYRFNSPYNSCDVYALVVGWCW